MTRQNAVQTMKVALEIGTKLKFEALLLQVFTTCGSDRKKKYLLDTFPQLREDHISNSRSTSFEELVMHMVRCIFVSRYDSHGIMC